MISKKRQWALSFLIMIFVNGILMYSQAQEWINPQSFFDYILLAGAFGIGGTIAVRLLLGKEGSPV